MYEQIFLYPQLEMSKIDDLSAMLSSTVLLYGESRLHDDFVTRISTIKPSALRRDAYIEILQNDTAKFDQRPSNTLTHIKDVNKDFYRFPSVIIFDLKILHGAQASSVWETIDCFIAGGILSSSIRDGLRAAFSVSMFVRLSAYCHHSSQDDRMTILEPVQCLKGGPWVFPTKLLIHYFIHCAPLQIIEGSVVITSYVGGDAHVDEHTLIWALFNCGDYKAVITCVGLMKGSHDQSWMIPGMYTYSVVKVGRCNKAIEILTREDISHKNGVYSSTQRSLMGYPYQEKGDYSSALEYHHKSLDIELKIHDDSSHPDIASSYNNISTGYQSQGDYSAALKYHHKSLDIKIKIQGDSPHPDIARSYNNTDNVYQSQQNYSSALDYHQKSLEIELKIHGDSPHPDIAGSYNNIGNVYLLQGNYSSALEYYRRSRDELRLSNFPETHPLYVMVMSNLEISLACLSLYQWMWAILWLEILDEFMNAI